MSLIGTSSLTLVLRVSLPVPLKEALVLRLRPTQPFLSNIKVSKVRLEPILGFSGASQLMGSVTNSNSKAVTVSSINFDIYKSSGELQQTTSAQPQPATIPPGGTVTFSQQLPTIPSDSGFQARLAKSSPVTIAGGV
jgi:hypothetical protein